MTAAAMTIDEGDDRQPRPFSIYNATVTACPATAYAILRTIIEDCVQLDPQHRPSASTILARLNQII
jgi:hypothetical protein